MYNLYLLYKNGENKKSNNIEDNHRHRHHHVVINKNKKQVKMRMQGRNETEGHMHDSLPPVARRDWDQCLYSVR